MIVACVLVQGYVNYTPDYVSKLRSMVKRHLQREHTFVCLTDQQGVDADRQWSIDTPEDMHPWWAKIHLFNPKLFRPGQVVMYLDLDVLIVKNLLDILHYADGHFTLVPHAGRWKGKGAMKVVPRFNSSCMVWRAEQGYHLYNAWSKGVTRRLWGDQDWIGERMPHAKTFPLEWFPRLSEVVSPPFPEEAKVILTKKPKNHIAAEHWPWFKEAWQ